MANLNTKYMQITQVCILNMIYRQIQNDVEFSHYILLVSISVFFNTLERFWVGNLRAQE